MAKLLPDGPIDTLGLRDAALALPEQLAAADATGPVDGLVSATDIDHVVIVAPGSGVAAAEIARVLASSVATLPVIVQPPGPLPAFVTARSLVIVASADDDPRAAATVEAATRARAAVVAVAPAGSAGWQAAADAGAPTVPVTADVPVARAAVGALTIHLLAILEQLGQYAELASGVAAAVAQIEHRRTELGGGGAAEKLASRIGRTLPVVYGGDDLGGVAARHWKRQINLGAKAAAFADALPGLADAEISGWGQHGDMTRQVFSLVTLRHDHEPESAAGAMAVVDELVDEVVHARHEVRAEGNGPLAQVLDLVFQGDLVSWHLSQELEIDPGPTAATSAVWSKP